MTARFVARVVVGLAFACACWIGTRSRAATPPAPTEHVTDHAGVLSDGVRRSLSGRLALYEERGGHQVIVWISDRAGEQSIEKFAVEAFEAWGVGNAKLDDGLALFVFTADRKLRIEVGYELESSVTDLVASRVIREVIAPRLRADDWDGGIVRGVEALVDTIEGQPGSLPSVDGPRERGPPAREIGPVQIAIMVALGLAFLILLVTHPRLALWLLWVVARGGFGGGGGGGGGFSGRGGRSGGGGATGGW